MPLGPLPWIGHEFSSDDDLDDLVLPTQPRITVLGETCYEVPVGPTEPAPG